MSAPTTPFNDSTDVLPDETGRPESDTSIVRGANNSCVIADDGRLRSLRSSHLSQRHDDRQPLRQ